MRKAVPLVMNTINIGHTYVPMLPALCLGTSLPRQKNNNNNNIIAANKYSSYCYNVNTAAVIPRHTLIVAGDRVQKLKPDQECTAG